MEALEGASAAPDTSVATAEPTPSSTGYTSEDAILDSVDEGQPEEAPAEDPVAAIATAEAKPVVAAPLPQTEEKPPEEYDPAIEQTLPQQRRDAFKRDPELRDSFYRDKAYQAAFPTVAEAREYKSLFPTLDYAKEAATHSGTLAELDRIYSQDPANFVAQLHRANPQAFSRMLPELRTSAYAADPQAFVDSFAKPQILDTLENLREAHANDETAQAAVEIVKHLLGGKEKPQQLPDNDPRLQRLEQLEQREQEVRGNIFNSFANAVSANYQSGLDKLVTEAIGKPDGMSDKAIEEVKGKVMRDVQAELDMDQRLINMYNQRLSTGRYDQEHLKTVVDFALAHARGKVGPKVRATMNYWTNDVLRLNTASRERAKTAANNKDIGSGVAAPQPGNGQEQVMRDPKTGRYVGKDGRRLSEDDILGL